MKNIKSFNLSEDAAYKDDARRAISIANSAGFRFKEDQKKTSYYYYEDKKTGIPGVSALTYKLYKVTGHTWKVTVNMKMDPSEPLRLTANPGNTVVDNTRTAELYWFEI